MAYRTLSRICFLAVLCGLTASSQQFPEASVPSARRILELSEIEQVRFVQETIDQGFPDERADQMTMLIINRSALTLPLIEGRLSEALRSGTASKKFADTASEMIAYAGNEHSLAAISRLMAIDEARFAPLISRTLDNAGSFRNPFSVAYRAFELSNETVSRLTMGWVESALTSDRRKRAWAGAMVDRYGKVPEEAEWAHDPIASRLKDNASSEIRQTVLRFAVQDQTRRKRR